MIKLLIADDHEMILRGLADSFRNEQNVGVVATVSDGSRVASLCETHNPDVVLLDFRMPGCTGDEITERILKVRPKTRILMFSSYEWEEDIWRSFINGASGYLSKASRFSEILNAINEVAAGRTFFPDSINRKILTRERREKLTKREVEVLSMLASGNDNKGIASALGVSEPTVKTHVARILAKIDANDRTHAVVKAAKRGIIQF